jgi:hypothetical protein
MNFIKNNPLVLIVAIIVLLSSLETCTVNRLKNENNDLKELVKYKDTQIDSIKNKFNQTVAEKEVAEVYNKDAIKKLSEEVFNLKKKDEQQIKQVNALIRIIQTAKLDTVFIPYDSSDTPVVDTGLVRRDSVVVPPKDFNYNTDSVNISGTVLLKGIRINSISLPDTASFRLAEKKTSFFKPRETVIQAIHTNPLYTTNGIQAITLKHTTNSWNRIFKPLLVGIAASFITYKVVK